MSGTQSPKFAPRVPFSPSTTKSQVEGKASSGGKGRTSEDLVGGASRDGRTPEVPIPVGKAPKNPAGPLRKVNGTATVPPALGSSFGAPLGKPSGSTRGGRPE